MKLFLLILLFPFFLNAQTGNVYNQSYTKHETLDWWLYFTESHISSWTIYHFVKKKSDYAPLISAAGGSLVGFVSSQILERGQSGKILGAMGAATSGLVFRVEIAIRDRRKEEREEKFNRMKFNPQNL